LADNDIAWESRLPSTTPILRTTAPHILILDTEPDPKIINVWNDLYEISRASNIATQTGQKLQANLFQDVMISAQYRLLHMQYDSKDPHELLRMVMLAYTTTIFSPLLSDFGGGRLSFPSLLSCLQVLLTTLDLSSYEKLKALLWLFVIARISISDDELITHQLAQSVQALNLSSWDEILVIMKGFLWIDVIHTDLAKKLFDKMLNLRIHEEPII
jgi:hypothetical protein